MFHNLLYFPDLQIVREFEALDLVDTLGIDIVVQEPLILTRHAIGLISTFARLWG